MFNNNLLMGAAAATSGASLVSVDNSALFNGTNYLARTPSSTGVEEKGTLSRWIYRTNPGSQDSVFAAYISGTQLFQIYFPTDDTLHVYNYSGGYDWQLATTQVFRDIGWIHIVVAIDTTQAVEDDRAIIYINGERVTALATTNYPSLNFVNDFNTSSVVNNLGPYDGASGNGGLSGYAAETVWIDGLQLTPFSFGEYDSSGLYWTPKSSDDIKTLTFGTNGFYLDNTTNAQTDASGQGNNFSNNGSVTTTTHTPTSLNALLNPLQTWSAYNTFSNGNRTVTGATSYSGVPLTIPVNMGGSNKWYMEFLIDAVDSVYPLIGVAPADFNFNVANAYAGSTADSISYQSGGLKITGGSTSSYGASFAATDVIGMLITESTGTVQFWKQTSGSGSFADQGNIVTSLSGDYLIAVVPKPSAQLTLRVDSSEWGNSSPPTGAKALTTTNLASATTRTASDTNK